MELVSIIVPIYKVEEYLDKCVESLVNQTYTDLEIILVDDGSPDNSPKICDAWVEKDERIKVIHKQNGGISDARNEGMKAATGKYIAFVDSDDWVENNYIEYLYRALKESNSDISVCGVKMKWENGDEKRFTKKGNYVLDNAEAFKNIITEKNINQVVWNKLYKYELIKDIKFEVGKIHEDVFWSYQAVAKASKVAIIEDQLYIYRQRQQSIMSDGLSLKSLNAIEAKSEILKFVKQNYPDLTVIAKKSMLYNCMYLMQRLLREKIKEKAQAKELKEKLNKYYKDNKFTKTEKKQLNKNERLIFNLADISLSGTSRLRNLLKKGI